MIMLHKYRLQCFVFANNLYLEFNSTTTCRIRGVGILENFLQNRSKFSTEPRSICVPRIIGYSYKQLGHSYKWKQESLEQRQRKSSNAWHLWVLLSNCVIIVKDFCKGYFYYTGQGASNRDYKLAVHYLTQAQKW